MCGCCAPRAAGDTLPTTRGVYKWTHKERLQHETSVSIFSSRRYRTAVVCAAEAAAVAKVTVVLLTTDYSIQVLNGHSFEIPFACNATLYIYFTTLQGQLRILFTIL